MTNAASREALARRTAEEVFAMLGTKWALGILSALGDGTCRFRPLQRALPGISHKMLTQTLKDLERAGIVSRHNHDTPAPHVDYALTTAGRALREQVYGMCAWSRRYLDDILVAAPGPARHASEGAEEAREAVIESDAPVLRRE